MAEEKQFLSVFYHLSEIDQNKKVIRNAVKMIWIGIILIMTGLFIPAFTNSGILPILSGAFVDVFSGAMIYLVNMSSKSKQKYFEQLLSVEHEQRIVGLIHSVDNPEFKEKMIEKVIDMYCR